MSIATLIEAESGAGKSTSLRNMRAADTLLIQAIPKPLPFKSDEWRVFDPSTKQGNIFVTDRANDILTLMEGTKRKIIILDDFQYVMANEFMRRSEERGYDKFTEIGRNAWNIMTKAAALPHTTRVYILTHTDTADNGRIKMKTIGRMLDEKITPEGMFTIVLRGIVRDGAYYFSTRNSGSDTVKTPMGLFAEELIDNDLNAVDRAICAYYGLGEATT